MRHLAITIGTAALVVGAFLALRSLRGGSGEPGATPEERRPAGAESRAAADKASAAATGAGVLVPGLPEVEALHRAHGAVGAAMRTFLATTVGTQWTLVDRARMQEVLHALRYSTREEDLPYLLDLFQRTKDPSFRWWFSWLVPQLAEQMGEKFHGEKFVDAMTEVHKIDPARGYLALAAINHPAATERFLKLLDAETDPEVSLQAVSAFAQSDWPDKEERIAGFAKDEQRGGAQRMLALGALGRIGTAESSVQLAMDIALGKPQPVTGLTGSLAVSHPIADVRSAAVLSIMQRGDQESARRLFEAADAAGMDSDLSKIVDSHLSAFNGPDLSELIYQRAARRQYVSPGEVHHLLRDLDRVDRARLRELLPLIRDPETKTLIEKILNAR
jgi:hypothetical protein